jgi:hypothetical protein
MRSSRRALVFLAAAFVLFGLTASTSFAQSAPPASVPPPASANQSSSQAPDQSPNQSKDQSKDQAAPAALAPGRSFHSVTVKFDYNFTATPACSEKIREHCVCRFVVYDISSGFEHRAKLFTIPVPDGAKGQVRGITATSPKLEFEPGEHELAVTAQEPSGIESRHYAATVWVVIP